jgi:hypothetical protein
MRRRGPGPAAEAALRARPPVVVRVACPCAVASPFSPLRPSKRKNGIPSSPPTAAFASSTHASCPPDHSSDVRHLHHLRHLHTHLGRIYRGGLNLRVWATRRIPRAMTLLLSFIYRGSQRWPPTADPPSGHQGDA